jgi:hypothetical protein
MFRHWNIQASFVIRHLDFVISILTGPGWERFPEGGPCETPPAAAQLRVVVAPRAMFAQGRDLDLRSRKKQESGSESRT